MCYELEHAFYYVGQIRTIRAAKQPQAERLFHRSRKICGLPCRGACLIGFPEPAQRRPRSTSQQRTAPRFSGGKENRSPAQRVRFGKEEPRCERALTFKKSRSKRSACSDLVEEGGFEPPKRNATDLQSAPFGHSGTPPYGIVELVDGFEPPTC